MSKRPNTNFHGLCPGRLSAGEEIEDGELIFPLSI
jgi:hypothetical protein